jgi:neuroligin
LQTFQQQQLQLCSRTRSTLNHFTLAYNVGFLQTAASPTPGQTRGKSKHAIPTQGNYGLLDISNNTFRFNSFVKLNPIIFLVNSKVAALVWLKDNIGGFGGDSNRITLSGHGTGAALVNLLMISPLAAGKLENQFFLFWLR